MAFALVDGDLDDSDGDLDVFAEVAVEEFKVAVNCVTVFVLLDDLPVYDGFLVPLALIDGDLEALLDFVDGDLDDFPEVAVAVTGLVLFADLPTYDGLLVALGLVDGDLEALLDAVDGDLDDFPENSVAACDTGLVLFDDLPTVDGDLEALPEVDGDFEAFPDFDETLTLLDSLTSIVSSGRYSTIASSVSS